MPFKSLTRIGLTSIWFGVSAQFYPAEAKPLATSEDCNAVGRVIKIANSQLPEGQRLCLGDSLSISPNKKLKFACYASGREVTLSPGKVRISDHCGKVSHRFRRCTNQYPVSCINSRDPSLKVRATLLFPYSSTVVDGRPSLSWEAEPQADRYTVELFLANQSMWKQTVSSNAMDYPAAGPLQPGKAYLIEVSAFRGNKMLSKNKSILNRLSEEKVATMKSAISSIDALPIPKLDKILDRDKIYISQGLLSESIGILKTQLKQDRYNPIVHRLLGDRYMNAGLPQEARPYFREAEFLAQKEQDRQELAKAQKGLAEIAAIPRTASSPTAD